MTQHLSMTSDSAASRESKLRRLAIDRRSDYLNTGRGDAFIVPLLYKQISEAIATYGSQYPRGAKMLDVGCGQQPFRGESESAGFTYFSMDVDQNRDGSVDFVCPIDGVQLPSLLAAGPFDFVLCTEVLEHVADWDAAFRNFGALLRTGGHLMLTCPHFYPLHEEPFDFWRPTLHTISFFAKSCGMRVVELKTGGDSLDVLGTWLGSTHIVAKDASFSNRLYAKLCRDLAGFFYRVIKKGRVRHRLQVNGKFYLANFAVLMKG